MRKIKQSDYLKTQCTRLCLNTNYFRSYSRIKLKCPIINLQVCMTTINTANTVFTNPSFTSNNFGPLQKN